MKAYICGSSALYYWRRDSSGNLTLKDPCKSPLSDCPTCAQDLDPLRILASDFGSEPLRLMVPCTEARIMRTRYQYSTAQTVLPARSFYNVTKHSCVASPELCLLQAASKLSLPRVMELCMELCGKYSMTPLPPRGFASRDFQLTTINGIESFISTLKHIRGQGRLALAIKFVVEGSRSPMETRVYLLLCLPKRYGGYGLPRPIVNARIELTPAEQRKTKRSYLECDMLWEDGKIVIEFDGHEDHASRIDRARDAIKRETLAAKGYTVFTITGYQVMDEEVFDSIARDIAKCIGHRMRRFSDKWTLLHSILREDLFLSLEQKNNDVRF